MPDINNEADILGKCLFFSHALTLHNLTHSNTGWELLVHFPLKVIMVGKCL